MPCTAAAGSRSALVAGAALPVQGAVNARLRADLDEPFAAARGSSWSPPRRCSPCSPSPLDRARRGRGAASARVPWWGWLGGLCGATYVTSVFLLIPESAWRRPSR